MFLVNVLIRVVVKVTALLKYCNLEHLSMAIALGVAITVGKGGL